MAYPVDGLIDRQALFSCLDEVDENFDTIERVLLALTEDKTDIELDNQQINGALRATHTIKGLGAMVGCHPLGTSSHRLEDYLKILKARRDSVEADDELQTWLLQLLDQMRQISTLYRQDYLVDEAWQASELDPLLDQIHERLGDLSEGDEVTLLSQNTETNITAVLFESEVGGLLQRLEGILADPALPCLREELDIIAQELTDLGQTLDLGSFTELCQSIHEQVAAAAPESVEAIAHQAVKDWRQTQALVAIGKTDCLPRHFRVDQPFQTVLDSYSQNGSQNVFQNASQSASQSALTQAPPVETLLTGVMPPDSSLAADVANAESTVRVPVNLLLQLNDLFGELTIQRNSLDSRLEKLDGLVEQVAPSVNRISENSHNAATQLREATADIQLRLRDIQQASNDIKRTTKELQIKVTRATMRPFADVVKTFPRQIRDLSAQYGKQVDFQVHGSSTLVDRHVLEALSNPLTHLLRNAFDHGIESPEERLAAGKLPRGRIDIWATHRGNQTLIFVQDDGAGIDLEKVRDRALQMGVESLALDKVNEDDLISLIFEPGFSTADQVSALSGRGIGMDIVRTDLTQVRGTIAVNTRPGEGTTFTISVPFTLSTIRALLVEAGGTRLAFSTDTIQEVVRLKSHVVHRSVGPDILAWEGLAVPLIRLDQWLGFNCPNHVVYQDDRPIVDEAIALLVYHESGLKGIYVDKFWGEREIVVRQVENVIPLPTGFIGCTILEDGHAVPLADTLKLIEWISQQSSPMRPIQRTTATKSFLNIQPTRNSLSLKPAISSKALPEARQSSSALTHSSDRATILVVDNSINARRLLTHTLEQEGYRVEQAEDGQSALGKLLNGLSVQAVLCDIEMPQLDGYGFLAEIKTKAQFAALPVVMVTSCSDEKHRQLAERLGAADYITKPYQDYQLLKALESQLVNPVHRFRTSS